MPFPGHRLDLIVVPRDVDTVPDAEIDARLLDVIRRRAEEVVRGGFLTARIERPGRVILYANGQGGFRVRCPVGSDVVTDAFARALTAWRVGGSRAMRCPACDATHPLEELGYEPPAAYASFALVLADVEDGALTEEGKRLLEDALGPVRVVARRVS